MALDVNCKFEIQDGRQDGRQERRENEVLGQYFEMGTYKFV